MIGLITLISILIQHYYPHIADLVDKFPSTTVVGENQLEKRDFEKLYGITMVNANQFAPLFGNPQNLGKSVAMNKNWSAEIQWGAWQMV